MESLSQVVLGGAVGEATLGKKTGNWSVMWGAIAGTIPDLDDIWARMFDPVTEASLHRGFPHSITFSILAAPVFGWLGAKIH